MAKAPFFLLVGHPFGHLIGGRAGSQGTLNPLPLPSFHTWCENQLILTDLPEIGQKDHLPLGCYTQNNRKQSNVQYLFCICGSLFLKVILQFSKKKLSMSLMKGENACTCNHCFAQICMQVAYKTQKVWLPFHEDKKESVVLVFRPCLLISFVILQLYKVVS